jgi:hypothetical protein
MYGLGDGISKQNDKDLLAYSSTLREELDRANLPDFGRSYLFQAKLVRRAVLAVPEERA